MYTYLNIIEKEYDKSENGVWCGETEAFISIEDSSSFLLDT